MIYILDIYKQFIWFISWNSYIPIIPDVGYNAFFKINVIYLFIIVWLGLFTIDVGHDTDSEVSI